jgi:5-methylcytosine-specific restriction endonuclease McrA
MEARVTDRRSAEAEEYRKLYKSARWRALRQQQLSRQPLCGRCLIEGKTTAATVANHRIPHKGDPALFWDSENLESTCKRHHDSHIQSEERRGYSKAVDASGWPSDPMHPANRGSAL